MLGRFKRKLSRTKSIPTVEDSDLTKWSTNDILPLSPSDEELIAQIKALENNPDDGDETHVVVPQRGIHEYAELSERTVINTTDRGFLSMPTEVLLWLQPYLRPSTEVALRHTCSRFLNLYSLPSFYLSGDDQFEFMCMAERDQDAVTLTRLVCGVCRAFHPKSAFPFTEIRQEPSERDCRQVWLCAHRCLGYLKAVKRIRTGVEAPFRAEILEPCSRCRDVVRNRSIADRPGKGTSKEDIEHPKAETLLISKIAIMQAPSPSYNEKSTSGSGIYKEVFPVKQVARALNSVNFPICAHIKMGDPYLLSRFCRSCINTQRLPPGVKGPPCISEAKRDFGDSDYVGKCRQSCFVRGCKTKFMFQTRESLAPDASGKRQIWLIIAIFRWLGPLQSEVRDAHWRNHIVNQEQRVEMRANWENMEKEYRVRKPMPNWSICLLNPEDSNLHSF